MNRLQDLPDRQLWSRAAAGGVNPAEIGTFTTPLVREAETVAAVGTKLAAQLTRALNAKNFTALSAEQPHPALAGIPAEAEEYASSSAGQGEIWSARQLLQLIRRSARTFAPKEDRRRDGDNVVDPFRPGLKYPARSDREFDLLLDRHLNAVRSMFRRSAVLIVALGASEISESRADRAVLPLRIDSPGDQFDPERQVTRTLTVDETIADLEAAIRELRTMNPLMRIVLMVSPEPPAATTTPVHVAAASAYGKAILRVAMEQAAQLPGVSYFPAIEILAGLGAAAFDEGGRVLTSKAVNAVVAAMLVASEGGAIVRTLEKDSPEAVAAFSPPPEPTSGEIQAERRRRREAEAAGTAPPAGKAPASKDPDQEFSELVRSRERQERKARRARARDKSAESAPEGDEASGASPQRAAPASPAGEASAADAKSSRSRRRRREKHDATEAESAAPKAGAAETTPTSRRKRRKDADATPAGIDMDVASAAAAPERMTAASEPESGVAGEPPAPSGKRRKHEKKHAADAEGKAQEGAAEDDSRGSRRRRRKEAKAASKTNDSEDASAGDTPAQPVQVQPEGSTAAEADGTAVGNPPASCPEASEKSQVTEAEHVSKKQRRREKKASKSGAAEGS